MSDASATTDDLFARLASEDRDAAFRHAADALQAAGRIDDLFDLRMLEAKLRRGLPADRPAALSEVPADHRREIEEDYRNAAREAGAKLIEQGDIAAAWNYFQVIREPGPIREALDALPIVSDYDETQNELAQIALYDQAYPARGVEMLLASSGMCNTVTAVDQVIAQMAADDRADVASKMTQALHASLIDSVRRDLEARVPLSKPAATLSGILTQHPTLLDGGQYHVDVSHLAAVVRFARSLRDDSPDIDLAIDLCEYGRRLDPSLRYGGEPPFEQVYESNGHFFRAVRGREGEREPGLDYFREKLAQEPDESDKPLLAYVLTDLLMRCGETEEAVAVAQQHLAHVAEQTGFSLAELCRRAGAMDKLTEWGQQNDDPVAFLNGRFGGDR